MAPIPERLEKTIRLDVVYREHEWRLFPSNGPLPSVKEGALGTLIVQDFEIEGVEARQRFTGISYFKLLDAEEEILIKVKEKGSQDALVTVLLDEPFVVRFKGYHPSGSEPTKCCITGFQCYSYVEADGLLKNPRPLGTKQKLNLVANSLNHAYTLTSGLYEQHRLSRGGSIYRHAFVLEGDKLVSLSRKREPISAHFEYEQIQLSKKPQPDKLLLFLLDENILPLHTWERAFERQLLPSQDSPRTVFDFDKSVPGWVPTWFQAAETIIPRLDAFRGALFSQLDRRNEWRAGSLTEKAFVVGVALYVMKSGQDSLDWIEAVQLRELYEALLEGL